LPLSREQFARAEELYFEANQLPQQEWPQFLDRRCADDGAVRDEVRALLGIGNGDGVAQPLRAAMDNALHSAAHASRLHVSTRSIVNQYLGKRIGPYLVEELVGEGGMGIVFRAQQERPVRRTVALKLIRAGMDWPDVVARFESERQALALMNHPNVARVFDAGTTEHGGHYFVMEYVAGASPITAWCDANRATVDQRLALATDVCEAVHHAHQRGVIHRDLKPTNVLVTVEGERPVVKVIDFGVAKAVERPLTGQSLHTRAGQLIGTPEYMSPEQAELGAHDVDTRTDIYALGVVLYELVTGSPPLDRAKLGESGLDEVLRAVRTVDPPRPSTRVEKHLDAQAAQQIAGQRRTNPARLVRRLRGELDWIIGKALEKDRRRRYASAAELAEDLRRYRANQPVLAGPPGTLYRVRKFVRRHRIPVAVSFLLLVALLAGAAGTTWQAFRALRAERNALRAQHDAERAERDVRQKYEDIRKIAETLLYDLDNSLRNDGPTKARQLVVTTAQKYLDALAAERDPDLALRNSLVKGYVRIGNVQYNRVTGGPVGGSLGDVEGALRSYAKALELQRGIAAEVQTPVARADVGRGLLFLGDAQAQLEDYEAALASYDEGRQVLATVAAEHPDQLSIVRHVALAFDRRAGLFKAMGRNGEAVASYREALKIREDLVRRFPDDRANRLDVARSQQMIREIEEPDRARDEQYEHMKHVMPTMRKALDDDPENQQRQRDMVGGLQRVAQISVARGNFAQALAELDELRPIEERLLRTDPHNIVLQDDVARSLSMRGQALVQTGRAAEGIEAYERALKMRRQLAKTEGQNAGRRRVADTLTNLSWAYRAASRPDDAVTAAREAADLYEQRYNAQPNEANAEPLRRALDLLADACDAARRNDEAEATRARRARFGPPTPTQPTRNWPQDD
jgi:serine/threonine protein kinase